MQGVLSAESAILFHFQSVRAVLLVLGGVIISLLAFCAGQRDLGLHLFHLVYPISKADSGRQKRDRRKTELLLTQIKPLHRGMNYIITVQGFCQYFLAKKFIFFSLFLH